MAIWAVSLLCSDLSTAVLTAIIISVGIRSLIERSIPKNLQPIQCSTPDRQFMTLALKLFRGEPAISRFDWHFTANHRSSGRFATHYGSALHHLLQWLQPAHGQVTQFRVYYIRLSRAINPRFHYGSVAFAHLTLPYIVTRWIVLQKARRHPAPLVLRSKQFQALFKRSSSLAIMLQLLFSLQSKGSAAVSFKIN